MNKELDIRTLLKAFRKLWPVVVAAVLVCSAIMAGYTMTKKPVYSAEADFLSVNNPNNETYTSSTLVSAAKELVNDYIEIAVSDVMLDAVADSLNGTGEKVYTHTSLRRMITVSKKGVDSAIYTVTVKSGDPEQAERVIGAVMENMQPVISELVMRKNAVKCLTSVPKAEKMPSGLVKNTMIGAVAGLVISVVIVVIAVLTDTKVRTESDLKEAFADIPVIGTVPKWNLKVAAEATGAGRKTNGGN